MIYKLEPLLLFLEITDLNNRKNRPGTEQGPPNCCVDVPGYREPQQGQLSF